MIGASTGPRFTRVAWLWLPLIACALALRVPSLVQPAGGDQGLYGYSGQRVLAGGVPYQDVWDQKPPGVAVIYAALWRVWPHESLVPASDLAAAACVAGLLVVLGYRRYSTDAGYGAAFVFLLFGNPSLVQRLSGVYVRGQCEPFIALAVTAAVVLVAGRSRLWWHLVLAGMALACAFWLKYNAVTYGLPVALAVWGWRRETRGVSGRTVTDFAWVGFGFALVTAGTLAYFAAHGALHDLRLATIDYNLRYSEESYDGSLSIVKYVVSFPVRQAGLDMLWFLGGVGALLVARQVRSDRSALVVLGWLTAAVLSIAINGGRSEPNYFVQAGPALALAAAAGLGSLAGTRAPDRSRWRRYGTAALLAVACWRVGDETGPGASVAGLRLAGLPGLMQNVRWDLAYARGRLDRATYLARFRGEQKYDALEIDNLSRYVRDTTATNETILVFGFSGGGVCWKSERVSASRFFWSRPVIIEFAADEPGYGSAGLLADLHQRPPALVVLQNESQWQSKAFFMNQRPLREWLEAGYAPDRETPMFTAWRRKR